MKQIRTITKSVLIMILICALFLLVPDNSLIGTPVNVRAAAMDINKKTLSLKVGVSAKLSITSTKKAIKWTSLNKKIATVSTKGKVTAIAAGKTKITASVSGKKFYCIITVKETPNPALAKAPFQAQEMKLLNIDFVMPADWALNYDFTETGVNAALTSKASQASSGIMITITLGDKNYKYSEVKSTKSTVYTQNYFDNLYSQKFGDSGYSVTDIKQSDLPTKIGNVLKTQYTLTLNGIPLTQQIYDFNIGSLLIQVSSDNYDGIDLSSLIEYVINSVILK